MSSGSVVGEVVSRIPILPAVSVIFHWFVNLHQTRFYRILVTIHKKSKTGSLETQKKKKVIVDWRSNTFKTWM
jgi:hypothetical protein